ncbi:MAG: hypothetical protein ACK4YQ_18325 [Phenylobacterium sp.]|uniref:hypothetical protein n=1 Tax=Phenylobacterium sp. TaxID=1871053 RepID=UPI00391BBF39
MQRNLAGDSIDRLAATEAAPVLARLEAAGLAARGCAVVISVGAVRERAGGRWPKLRDEVWARLNARLDGYLEPDDLRARLNDTDLLVATARGEATAVRALALRVLEELVIHYLGAAEPVDLRLAAVESVDGTLISTYDLDPGGIAADWRADGRFDLAALRGDVDFTDERRCNPIHLPATDSEQLRVQFSLEPVTSLKHDRLAALRVHPTVSCVGTGRLVSPDQWARLSDDHAGLIDQAALEFAALFLSRQGRTSPPLIVPASFRTLGGRRGRRRLTSLPGVSTAQAKGRLVIELVDVDRGTPPGRLAEVAALVGAVCRGVFVRLRPAKNAEEPLRQARLQGLTLDFGDAGDADRQVVHQVLAAAEQARALAPVLVAHGLPSEGFYPIAQVAGFTHAAMRPGGALDDVLPAAAA